jgi:PadR family transcriptional regulator, regulatory protein PadR
LQGALDLGTARLRAGGRLWRAARVAVAELIKTAAVGTEGQKNVSHPELNSSELASLMRRRPNRATRVGLARRLRKAIFPALMLTSNTSGATLVDDQQERVMNKPLKADVLQGTLDAMVLKTLDTLGPTHGYGIARRIEQVSNDLLRLNQGTIYPALVRLQQRGWITSHWGESDNKRRAKFYEITRAGRRHLAAEIEKWERVSWVVSRLLTEEA